MKRLRLFGSQETIQILFKVKIQSLETVTFFEELAGKTDAIFRKEPRFNYCKADGKH